MECAEEGGQLYVGNEHLSLGENLGLRRKRKKKKQNIKPQTSTKVVEEMTKQ